MKCQIENQQHHADKNRDRGIFSGQNFVGTDRTQTLLALMRLDDAGFDKRFNERIAHIRDGCVAVKAAFEFHLDDGMLDQFLFVLVKVQLIQNSLVAVNDPRRREADGKPRALRVIFNLVADGVNAAVDRAGRAEIDDGGQAFVLRRVHGRLDQCLHAVAGGCTDWNDRHAQLLRKLVRVDAAAVAGQLVHHIERQHRRHAQRQ